MTEGVAYKVLTAEQVTALREGVFEGAPVDLSDGYIHLSTATQLTGTVQKHFAGRQALMLAAVDLARLGDALRWEVSRGDEKFPHLYGRLTMDAVTALGNLEWADGQVKLPQ
jgi:uncharacterized protein (DUF952 family)